MRTRSPARKIPLTKGKPWFDDSLLEVPSEYPTIQAAIYAASNGDTILLQSGSYGSFVHDGAFHGHDSWPSA